jgi:hypothetical protein
MVEESRVTLLLQKITASDLPNFGALLWVVSFWGATHPWLTIILL